MTLPLNVFVTDAKREKIVTDKVKVDVDVALDKPIGYFSMVRTVTLPDARGLARPASSRSTSASSATSRAPASAAARSSAHQPTLLSRFARVAAFVDFGRLPRIIRAVQSRSAEETGSSREHSAGAEGATAPETLRQKDRRLMALWKAAGRSAGSPKG